MALTTAQTRHLRGLGQQLKPLIIIGKDGITDAAVKQADETMEKRELVKFQILPASGLETRDTANRIAEKLHSEIVQVIGNRFVLYRRSSTPGIEHLSLS